MDKKLKTDKIIALAAIILLFITLYLWARDIELQELLVHNKVELKQTEEYINELHNKIEQNENQMNELQNQIQEKDNTIKELEDKLATKSQKSASNVSTSTNTTNIEGYMKFTATAYCPCSKCCGQYASGYTASGTKATANRTVAMSSSYKFGTKIEIKDMGTYIVEDRGGAIQGNKIDIYFDTHQEALNFGRRTVYLKVVE